MGNPKSQFVGDVNETLTKINEILGTVSTGIQNYQAASGSNSVPAVAPPVYQTPVSNASLFGTGNGSGMWKWIIAGSTVLIGGSILYSMHNQPPGRK